MNLNTCYICKSGIPNNKKIYRCCDQTLCSESCSNLMLREIKTIDFTLKSPSNWYTEKSSYTKIYINYQENNIDFTKEFNNKDYPFFTLNFVIRNFLPTIIIGIYSASKWCCAN